MRFDEARRDDPARVDDGSEEFFRWHLDADSIIRVEVGGAVACVEA